MTKRIISGVFLLIALGALGLILAGALTSGEQLIVRFLTAIIVAALGLYVISDLRLQAEDSSAAAGAKQQRSSTRRAHKPSALPAEVGAEPPPDSTVAFMATVTGRRSAVAADTEAEASDDVEASRPTIEQPAISADADPSITEDSKADGADEAAGHEAEPVASGESVESPYSSETVDAAAWPVAPDGRPVADSNSSKARPQVDALTTLFQQADQRPVGGTSTPTTPLVEALAAADVDAASRPTAPDSPTPPVSPAAPVAGDGDAQADDHDDSGDGEANTTPATEATGVGSVRPAGDEVAGQTAGIDLTEAAPAVEATVGAGTAASTPGDDTSKAAKIETEAQRPEPVAATGPGAPQVAAIAAVESARSRIVDLRVDDAVASDLEAAIRAGERDVIESLIDEGVLSSIGPISDEEVRTMVYVAFTSSELRKILLSGGTLDGDFTEVELGPVEVFSSADGGERTLRLRTIEPLPPLAPLPTATDRSEPIAASPTAIDDGVDIDHSELTTSL